MMAEFPERSGALKKIVPSSADWRPVKPHFVTYSLGMIAPLHSSKKFATL
jgi:hypothetical protein